MGCNTAISGLEDALVLGKAISADTTGIYLWASSVNIVGVRVEFNTQNEVALVV